MSERLLTMQESTRIQYLSLLGIEQWLPRDSEDESAHGVVARESDVLHAEPVRTESAQTTLVKSNADSAITSVSPMERLDALLAQTAPLPAALSRAVNDEVPQKFAPVLPAGERVGCALLMLPGGLLLVADFSQPDAPGLSSAEHTLLLRVAAALVPGQTLPSPKDFSWPPVGVRVPGMDKPGAAHEALRAMLEELRRRGLRDIAVLGEASSSIFNELAVAMNLPLPVCTLSLAVMVAEPERKRECWNLLAPLKRDAAT